MHSTCTCTGTWRLCTGTGTGTWRLGTGTCTGTWTTGTGTGTGTCLLSTWYKTAGDQLTTNMFRWIMIQINIRLTNGSSAANHLQVNIVETKIVHIQNNKIK